MRLVLNVLWIVFGGGFFIALEYFLAGLLLCLTVIGIPFGLQAFKLAGLAFLPFGKDVEEVSRGSGNIVLGGIANVLWLVFAGIWIFISQITVAVACAVTIIGIPFAIQHLKLAVLALWPFGRRAR